MTKHSDPFFEREKEKYSDPIPSREFILSILDEYGRPISKPKLIELLKIEGEAKEAALQFRLRAMMRDGQIMQNRRNRFCLVDHLNLKRGHIIAHSDGYGFFVPEDGKEDMVLTAREMRTVMHGDKVLAYPIGLDRRGRTEAKVHEIVEHAHTTIVGKFNTEHGISFVLPDNKRLTHTLFIPAEDTMTAKPGQMVLAEIVSYPTSQNQPIAKIIHIIGDHMAPGLETEVSILAHGIPHEWPDDLLLEVKDIPKTVTETDIVGRADLRKLPFVTIDGEDAKDFDDAVFCKSTPKGGYLLYVAIADVSHYVEEGTQLDIEAKKRGNSVYFPSKVVPMLPEALSNGICSLNPHLDRLCMVAEMAINKAGSITRSRFYPAVIHSHARLTYTMVGSMLSEKKPTDAYHDLWPHLQSLYDVYQILVAGRKIRGAMDFETVETKITFDENRKIQSINPTIRNEAHKLIEECMLAANVAVAKFLQKSKLPTLYRVHETPNEEKIAALRLFLGEFGLQLAGGKAPKPKDFQATLAVAATRPDAHIIQTVMLRSMKQAQYTEAYNIHFGLAYPIYTHFTSPIRRYPDLLIHRALKYALQEEHETIEKKYSYTEAEMSALGQHCSTTERRADDATRDVVSWLKCEYMQDKLGQTFTGRISSVTSFGIFVELDNIFVEGLVHITSLKNDYYQFDAVKHRLLGARTGQTYRLGDKIDILVARVALDDRKIDFELAES